MAKSARTIFQLVALVFLLIVFPAASWYYLNSGLQYRRSAMAELKAYGTFPIASWTLADGSALASEYLAKKMLVAHVFPKDSDAGLIERYGQTLQQLHNQFDERNELLFLTIMHMDTAQLSSQINQFSQAYELDDQEQMLFVQADDRIFADLEKNIFHPEGFPEIDSDAFFLLTDSSATIRRYYDVREERDIKRLVEHIALLLPLKKDRELIFRREVEK